MEELPESESLAKKAEEYLFRFRYPVLITLLGLILIGVGAFFVKSNKISSSSGIEVLKPTTTPQNTKIFVELGGAVVFPGVYSFDSTARVEELLIKAGGLSENADREFVEKNINRAAKLSDGQKFYIPSKDEEYKQSEVLSANTSVVYQSGSNDQNAQNSTLVNINTASLSDLDKLPGIGPVYAQKIIDQRPYSSIEDLQNHSVVPKSTFEKIKNLITI